jgi:hypothetical protein
MQSIGVLENGGLKAAYAIRATKRLALIPPNTDNKKPARAG